jgi:hypothetical protein
VRRPSVKVLFVTRPEMQEHTEGLDDLVPTPAAPADVVAMAGRLLGGPVATAPPHNVYVSTTPSSFGTVKLRLGKQVALDHERDIK